jgi:hypothetical protein
VPSLFYRAALALCAGIPLSTGSTLPIPPTTLPTASNFAVFQGVPVGSGGRRDTRCQRLDDPHLAASPPFDTSRAACR